MEHDDISFLNISFNSSSSESSCGNFSDFLISKECTKEKNNEDEMIKKLVTSFEDSFEFNQIENSSPNCTSLSRGIIFTK